MYIKKTITLLSLGLVINLSLQAAVPIKKDTIPEKNGIGLRNAYDDPTVGVYHTRPLESSLPANSIRINRHPVITNYTPDDLVRKILLNSNTPADAQRIQNVRHIGWNWDQTTKQWKQQTANPQSNVWGNAGQAGIVYDQDERSLAYFENGRIAGFEIDSGLLIGTGPVLMAEGPNITNHGMSDGIRNDGVQGMHANGKPQGSNFTALPFQFKHQPNQPWIPTQSFDRDLDALTSDNIMWTTCGSVLEFDFQPAAGIATFDYVFASDEYPEGIYQANDIFGFFVTGPYDAPPGYDIEATAAAPSKTDPTLLTEHTRTDTVYYRYNIARLPDGKPVGIDYVNWGLPAALYTPLMSTPYMTTTSADYFEAKADTMTYSWASSWYRGISGSPTEDPASGTATQWGMHNGAKTIYYAIPTNPHLFKYNHVGQNMMDIQ